MLIRKNRVAQYFTQIFLFLQEKLSLKKDFSDNLSRKTFDRPRNTVLKEDVLRPGDTLILYELDRLRRNKKRLLMSYDIMKIMVFVLCFLIY